MLHLRKKPTTPKNKSDPIQHKSTDIKIRNGQLKINIYMYKHS